jgi:hypothetical protein
VAQSIAGALMVIALRAGAPHVDAGPSCQMGPLPDPETVKRSIAYEDGEDADRLGRGPRTGQDALRARIPVMPGALTPLTNISDGVETYGVPMNLAVFETEAPATEVLKFYSQYFQDRGWDMTGPKENFRTVPYPAVSATDSPEALQLSVMVMGREPRGSTVVLGLADMKAVKQKGAHAWKETQLGDLPLYPGSDPLTLRSRDQERLGFTVNFDTPDPVAKVADFYRKELSSRGYREQADPMPPDERVVHLQFSRDGHTWNLALSPNKGRTLVTALGSE